VRPEELAEAELITTRLGEVVVRPQEIIHFPAGILPFTAVKRFVLISRSDQAPFVWLVAADEPELAFVVVGHSPEETTVDLLASRHRHSGFGASATLRVGEG